MPHIDTMLHDLRRPSEAPLPASVPALSDPISEARAVAATALTLPEQARALVIDSHEHFEVAGAFLVQIKQRRQAIADRLTPGKKLAYAAYQEWLGLEREADAPCAEAERITKAGMATYQADQERARRIAEDAAAAERRRLEIAAQALVDEERRAAEAAAELARDTAAEAAMDAGDLDAAEAILEAPLEPVLVAPPAPILPLPVEAPPIAKAAGVSFRQKWSYRIVDPARIDRRWLEPDEKKIRQTVTALGADAALTIGGIEVFAETIVSARGR